MHEPIEQRRDDDDVAEQTRPVLERRLEVMIVEAFS